MLTAVGLLMAGVGVLVLVAGIRDTTAAEALRSVAAGQPIPDRTGAGQATAGRAQSSDAPPAAQSAMRDGLAGADIDSPTPTPTLPPGHVR